MRKMEFFVPSEVMAEFAEAMTGKELRNTITGTTEENDIIVEVEYERDESEQVDELEETLDNLIEQLEEDEEEDEK